MKAAAIDIGSNSILLTIVEFEENFSSPKILHDEARVIGLAKGVHANGNISVESCERAKDCLRDYRSIIDRFSVEADHVRVAATEGLRRPRNGKEVRRELEEVLGFTIELISGQEEAELSFWSVEHEFESSPEASKVVFDIGGASTELIWGNRQGPQRLCSIPMGCVLLSEAFGLDKESEAIAAQSHFESLMMRENFFKELPDLSSVEGFGVAGTMTSLIAVAQSISPYKREKVHGQSIFQKQVIEWRDKILSLPLEKRKQLVGLEPKRADVFGAGLVILSCLMKAFQWNKVRCADSGVRFGLLYQMAPTSK